MAERNTRLIQSFALLLVALLAGGLLAACTADDKGERAPDLSVDTDTPVGLCGVPNTGVVSAQPAESIPDSPIQTVIDGLVGNSDTRNFSSFAMSDDTIAVLYSVKSTGNVVTTYTRDGKKKNTFTITEKPGKDGKTGTITQVTLGPDGAIYAIGSGENRWSLIKMASDGKHEWTKDLKSRLPSDDSSIYGIFAWHDADGGFAVGVGVDGKKAILVAPDGSAVDETLDMVGSRFAPQPDGSILTLQDIDNDAEQGSYIRHYGADGKLLATFGGVDEKGGESATGGPYLLGNPSGLGLSPEGNILILDSQSGIEWAEPDGVRRGIWASKSGDADKTFTLVPNSPLVNVGDDYYFLSASTGGSLRLISVTAKDMQWGLQAPMRYNAGHAPSVAALGYGAGLRVSAPFGYYPAGATPSVDLVFDKWWSTIRDKYDVTYTVTPDPRTPQPKTAEPAPVEIPEKGGSVPLTLPAPDPGIYEVSVSLLDKASNEPVSGTCLRYTIGPPGATLDFQNLADGQDWGGPAPLRGVQLAAELGIGSYRYQLDFGQVVTDPSAQPSDAGLSFDGLPKLNDDDPIWSEVAQAVKLADQLGVKFMVQIGQGGDAEKKAVSSGTWGGWIGLIVAAFEQNAPGVLYWQPWNEPNNTGFDDGGTYVSDILKPFAAAAKQASPTAQIVDGNTLGVAIDWWKQYVAAGGPAIADIFAIHPYTGYNRSWEEEGFNLPDGPITELKQLLAQGGGGDKPIWDTESGWWSDGPANFWQQGDDVARKLMWYRAQGIGEWTYFFSEGGFEYDGPSWSLIQFQSYLKTGAVAYMTTSAMLKDRAKPTMVDTKVPFTYAMNFASTTGGDQLLAAWSSEFTVAAELGVDSSQPVTVTATNIYGAKQEIVVQEGKPAKVTLSGSPVFYTAPAGVHLTMDATESYGDDVLKGAAVTASSTAEGTSPDSITGGTVNNTAPWKSGKEAKDGKPDLSPSVTVSLGTVTTIDRIAVATPAIRCCTAGLRDYTVSVKTADGDWKVVGTVKDQFYDRVTMVSFDPTKVTAVKVQIPSTKEKGVTVVSSNYSGTDAGLHPPTWPLKSESDEVAAISAISAWAPGQ